MEAETEASGVALVVMELEEEEAAAVASKALWARGVAVAVGT